MQIKEQKKEPKKVQVSIPADRWDDVKKRWVDVYGFDTVARAARVLLMGDMTQLSKELKKTVNNAERIAELKRKASTIVIDKPEEKHAGLYFAIGSKVYDDYVASIKSERPDFMPPDGKGVRVWLDDRGERKVGFSHGHIDNQANQEIN